MRLGLLTAAVALAARTTEFVPVNVAAFIHVIAWGLWLGSNVWTTFVAGITMFKNLPRQTFGRLQVRPSCGGFQLPLWCLPSDAGADLTTALSAVVQSKLFPQYFTVAVCTGILQLGTLTFGIPGGIGKAQLLTLGELACVQT